MDNYKIIMTGQGQGKIYRNGEELKGVAAVKFAAGVNEVNTIELTYHANTVEIEAECEENNV